MSVSRPLNSTWKNLRMRLVSAQSSTSSRRNERAFLLRRAPPVDRDRHEVDVELRMQRAACAPSARAAAGGRRSRRSSQKPQRLRQVEERAQVRDCCDEALLRPRQLQLDAGVLQHREVRDAAALEHVADGIGSAVQARDGIFGTDGEAHPEGEEPSQQPVSCEVSFPEPSPRRRESSGRIAEATYSNAAAGRSSAIRKYSNRWRITRSWLCRR